MSKQSPQGSLDPVRIVYIISSMPSRWIAFEWIARHLDHRKFALSFILLHNGEPPFASFLRSHNLPALHIQYGGKRDLPRAIRVIHAYLRERRIEIVHTHFMLACLCGLASAALARVSVRIHTRHYGGRHEQDEYKGWVRVCGWFNNCCSTRIIAPSDVVKGVLCEAGRVRPDRIERIDHGFDLGLYGTAIAERALRHERGEDAPVIGVVARFEILKGIQYIIPAFQRLLQDFPRARLVLANAYGQYAHSIRQMLREMLPEGSYDEILFEPDPVALYGRFDIFVHTPLVATYEAFGQVYVEALAAGLPSVFTPAGIAAEFIVDQHNAHLVPFRDSDAIYRSLKFIVTHPAHSERLVVNGLDSVRDRFGLGSMISSLETLYWDMTRGKAARRSSTGQVQHKAARLGESRSQQQGSDP